MPPLVVALAVYIGTIAATIVVYGSIIITLASIAYSAYMMATMEKPSSQSDATNRTQTVRSTVQPHRIIYGEVMTGGVLVYAQSHSIDPETNLKVDGTNIYISLVVVFCAHEVEQIKEIWLNDKLSTDVAFKKHVDFQAEQGFSTRIPDPTGDSENGIYVWTKTRDEILEHDGSWVHINKYTGTLTQEADPFLMSLPPNPSSIISSYPQSGLNDLVIKNNDDGTGTFTGIGVAVFTIKLSDLASNAGATAGFPNDTFTWKEQKYEGDGSTLDNAASGTLSITGDYQLLAEGIQIKFSALTGHSIGQTWEIRVFDGSPWTSDCKLTNRAYVVVTMEKNDTIFPNGLPNVKALILGNNKIYNPRTELTNYSNNWALCVNNYLTSKFGLNAVYEEDINETVLIAAANICDEDVLSANGATQKRYPINGSFTVDKTPTAIMNEIFATAYGAITWTQGQYRILPAAYYAPDLTFYGMNSSIVGLTDSDLRGSIKVRPLSSMKDKFNTVKGTFVSTETWQTIDFPKVTNALYLEEDGGIEIVKDIQLSYVTDAGMAQRIAKIVLEKSRQSIAVDFPAKWSAFPLAVGDNVPITINYLGWAQKIFTVRDWKMNPEGGIDLQLQEDAIGCYAWNSGEETTVDLAPNTILPDARIVSKPIQLASNYRRYDTNSNTNTRMDLYITWSAGDGRAVKYQVQYEEPSAAIWLSIPDTSDTVATVNNLLEGTYNIRVRAISALGVMSDWVTTSCYVPLPDFVIPDITGLEIFGQGNITEFVGKDIKLDWRKVSPRVSSTVDSTASVNQNNSWFRYYELKVFTENDVLLRTEYLATESYNYDYEKNYADNSGLPKRNVKFELRAVSTWGEVSANPAKLEVNNPPVAKLTGIVLTGGVNIFSVALPVPLDSDFAGFIVCASQTSGFTPGTSNQINTGGSEAQVTKTAATVGVWYVRAAAYDSFGSDGAIYSDEYSVTVNSFSIDAGNLDAAQRVDFYIRNSNFYFATATLNWSDGYIDRADKTYTLAAGTLATASACYIIATLNDSTNIATLSKSIAGTGLPTLTDLQVIIAITSDWATGQGNYICFVRQANSASFEGALIRDATITDAKITGTLSANKITSLNGSTSITGEGVTLIDINNTSTSASSAASSAASAASAAQSTANGAANSASTANSLLADIASDSKLTPNEKIAVKKEYDSIVAENDLILMQADNYSISSSSFTTAYDNLFSYIGALLANMAITENIVGSNFRNYFTNYYTARTELLQAIADKTATLASWAGVSGIPGRFNDAPVGAGLSLTSTYMGYYNGSAWKTYMDSSGNFALAGSGTHALSWDGSTLNIRGNLNAGDITAGNLSVERITAGNITNPTTAYTPDTKTVSDSDQVVQSVSITTVGASVFITSYWELNAITNVPNTFTYYIKRDSTTILTVIGSDAVYGQSCSLLDTPSAGTHTYSVVLQTSGGTKQVRTRTLSAVEFRK